MRAVRYDAFGGPLQVRDVDPPSCPPDAVVIRVSATGRVPQRLARLAGP